jgi:hypothetical protein
MVIAYNFAQKFGSHFDSAQRRSRLSSIAASWNIIPRPDSSRGFEHGSQSKA